MAITRTRILTAMLVASVTINIGLAHKLRRFNQLLGIGSDSALKSGSALAPFDAIDLKGQTHTVAYSQASKPTVLYVFTPTCSWCLRNMDNFKGAGSPNRNGLSLCWFVSFEGGTPRLRCHSRIDDSDLHRFVDRHEKNLQAWRHPTDNRGFSRGQSFARLGGRLQRGSENSG